MRFRHGEFGPRRELENTDPNPGPRFWPVRDIGRVPQGYQGLKTEAMGFEAGNPGLELGAVVVGGRATGILGSQNRPQEEEEHPGQTWLLHTGN